MMMVRQRIERFIHTVAAVVALGISACFLHVPLVSGQEAGFATDWQGGERSQLRLITGVGEWQGKNQVLAGIEINLAPNWKTYWRTPGDTGIPPEFDWSGSENLAKAEVLYPVPFWFEDPVGFSIGYKHRVTFPVVLTPQNPQKPIKLKLNAAYAICHDLCVPLSSEHSLVVQPPVGGPFGPVFSLALAEVPKPVATNSKIGIRSVTFVEGKKSALMIEVQGTKPGEPVDLFVEGLDGLYVPTPKRVSPQGGGEGKGRGDASFKIDLGDVDNPEAYKQAKLTCTLKVASLPIVQPCNVR